MSAEQKRVKCTMTGCINVGVQLEGDDCFVCDVCYDKLIIHLAREYEKRILKRIARHAMN